MSNVKKRLKEIAQGIAIGIANIIPGFSGGTMAIIFRVYEKILNALSTFFEHPIKVIKDIWALALGMIIGIIVATIAIVRLIEYAPIPTIMFFIGLMLGTIPFIYMETKSYGKVKIFDIIGFIIAILTLVVISLLKESTIANVNMSFMTLLIMFAMGIIAAATMVIPGVSGSLILLVLGYYFVITNNISILLDAVSSFNFTNIWDSFFILFAFGIGVIVGMVSIAKLIKVLLKKAPRLVYWIILGLLLASPYSIVMAIIKEYPTAFQETNIWEYIIAFVMLALGTLISGFFSVWDKKQNKRSTE